MKKIILIILIMFGPLAAESIQQKKEGPLPSVDQLERMLDAYFNHSIPDTVNKLLVALAKLPKSDTTVDSEREFQTIFMRAFTRKNRNESLRLMREHPDWAHRAIQVYINDIIFKRLVNALARQDVTTVQKILKNNPKYDFKQVDNKGDTFMHAAALGGSADIIVALAQQGVPLDIHGSNGYTPLHISIIKNYFPAMEALMSAGADVNVVDEIGATPLHYAAATGDEQMVNYLLARGADPNLKSRQGLTPLAMAQKFEKSEVAIRLRPLTKEEEKPTGWRSWLGF